MVLLFRYRCDTLTSRGPQPSAVNDPASRPRDDGNPPELPGGFPFGLGSRQTTLPSLVAPQYPP